MPVHIRNFYYNKLVKIKKNEAKEVEASQKKSKVRVNR